MARFTLHARLLITGTGLSLLVAASLMIVLRWFHPAVFSYATATVTFFVGAGLAILPLLQRTHD
ncbi:hypothetical protein CL628_00760 [bacterium]|nr:hypothetical protein [bacterium]|tara:strand:+ start:382 stop:573 length:192 start_codon:yes stop_codon:yes gene_type:complete